MSFETLLNSDPQFGRIKDIKTLKLTIKKHIKNTHTKNILVKYNLGNAIGIYLHNIPLFIELFKPNFKVNFYLFGVKLASINRAVDQNLSAKKEHQKRKNRIYFSIGKLAFETKMTGIPRVVKELCTQGLNSNEITFVPIYLDLKDKKYRVASFWIKSQTLDKNKNNLSFNTNEDIEISVQKGDWIIYSGFDEKEWEHMKSFQRSFKKAGGMIGTILYDLIPIEYPQFCTARASHAFKLWLYYVTEECNAVFSISKTVQDAYKNWLNTERPKKYTPYQGFFHLGANFNLNKTMKHDWLPAPLKKDLYYMQVSTVEPRKGYSDLLAAFEKLWKNGISAALVIVGKKGWMVEELSERIEKHPQKGKLLFWFQNASDEELQSLYHGARAIVFASEAEGFGLAAMEGLYYGKPVIVRDIPVFREIGGNDLTYFNNGVTGLFDTLLENWNSNINLRPKLNTIQRVISWQQSYNQLIEQIKQASKS